MKDRENKRKISPSTGLEGNPGGGEMKNLAAGYGMNPTLVHLMFYFA